MTIRSCRTHLGLVRFAPVRVTLRARLMVTTIGALIIRIGFWGPLYCNYKKEPRKEYR